MVDQLSAFASETARVVQALEVGTQGMSGGQAKLVFQGTWADLTRNVNVCAFVYAILSSALTNDKSPFTANGLECD